MELFKVRIGNSVVEFQSDVEAGTISRGNSRYGNHDVMCYKRPDGGAHVRSFGYKQLNITKEDFQKYKSFWMEYDY